ncbi:hypothetical protein [Sinomicrobium soli]|uniref:hypothetical protein n=1 Tax=Sinomicrobium sp. N-1-3-6 TaxID=2219864 RepID=UPI000DCD510F|nr:hypothetical protein [Sinomicrobium sp. N-1-3-6]RAV28886.1 hypothetical protein DN748_10825 [Sinomicrobium sp. N-1-3-6]
MTTLVKLLVTAILSALLSSCDFGDIPQSPAIHAGSDHSRSAQTLFLVQSPEFRIQNSGVVIQNKVNLPAGQDQRNFNSITEAPEIPPRLKVGTGTIVGMTHL